MFLGGPPSKIRCLLPLVLIFILFSLFFSSPFTALAKPVGQAANEFNYTPPSLPSTALGFIYTFFRLIFSLIVVFAIFLGGVYLFKKFSWSNLATAQPGEGAAKLISTVSLGGGRFVHFVKISDRVIVLGSSDGGVNLLLELDPLEAKEMIDLHEAQGLGSMESFEATLFRLYSGWPKPIVERSRKVSKNVFNDLKDRIEIWKQRTVRK